MIEKLTQQEEEAMLIVWKTGGGFIKDFLEHYPAPRPPYTTLASIIKNLARKGFVQSARYGNVYEYRPLINESKYKAGFMSGFVKDYFSNSYKELVGFFAKEEKITPQELREILQIIENQHKNRK
jgi:predicted transcriptional regulator